MKTTRVGADLATGSTVEQDMMSKNKITKKHIAGAVVFTVPVFDTDPTLKPFLNDTFGTAMNQDVSFGGTPELIFDGGSGGTEWAGSGNAQWNFASGGKVVLSNGTNNSVALFEDAGTVVASSYAALTGKVDLDTYNPATDNIMFQFSLAGTPLGVALPMNDYIDTSDFAEQEFAIPMTDFVLGASTVDEFTMTVVRSGGSRPDISFDDFTLQETGTPLLFTVRVPESETYLVKKLSFLFVDNTSGITTVAGATENATVPNLSYNKILGVSSLANGIIFTRVQNNKKIINLNLKDLGDFLTFTTITDHISDGVNTLLKVEIALSENILLDGKTNDELSLTINDDLSGLVKFTALSRGVLRSDPTDKDDLFH